MVKAQKEKRTQLILNFLNGEGDSERQYDHHNKMQVCMLTCCRCWREVAHITWVLNHQNIFHSVRKQPACVLCIVYWVLLCMFTCCRCWREVTHITGMLNNQNIFHPDHKKYLFLCPEMHIGKLSWEKMKLNKPWLFGISISFK